MSQIHRVRNPSTEVGAEPEHTVVTGCSVRIRLVACGTDSVVVEGVRAELVSRDKVEFDGTTKTMPRLPDINLSPEETDEAIRQSVAHYRRLDPPHLEVLLDGHSPVVRPARGTTQEPVTFPVTLQPGNQLSLFVAPITADERVTSWILIVDWRVSEGRDSMGWPLRVTGATGFRVVDPGEPSRPADTSVLAPDHWIPVPDTCWGDLAQYVAARHAADLAAAVDELLGLPVLLPRIGTLAAQLVMKTDAGGLLGVFTSNSRMRAVLADLGMELLYADVLPFTQLLETVSRSPEPLGVAVDQNTELCLQFAPAAVPKLIEHGRALLACRGGSP
ncbi:hypothetical protein [Kutzneria sp. NPDC052558]|uniref:hypothetical protein n=1 Tax=Kutzneria sp. NPDC052558 TaxID=3364121 RepID=UPI0037C6582F